MQVGTLSANPVAAVAGLATLEILRRPGAYEHVFAIGRELMGTLTDLLRAADLPAQVIGEPPLFDVVFSREAIRDYRGTLRGNAEMQKRFNGLLRDRSILKGDSKYYVSTVLTDADIKQTVEAWKDAIKELAS
jgi:glutamate-1-semialdehyde 2,1-aminomutase